MGKDKNMCHAYIVNSCDECPLCSIDYHQYEPAVCSHPKVDTNNPPFFDFDAPTIIPDNCPLRNGNSLLLYLKDSKNE